MIDCVGGYDPGEVLIPTLQRDMIDIPHNLSGFTFRVMQWNVLAQAFTPEFLQSPKEALQYDVRKKLIVDEILARDSHIVCLQEVDMFSYLQSELAHSSYAGFFKPKLISPTLEFEHNIGPDGCSLFYRKDVLNLIHEREINIQVDGKLSNQVAIICSFAPRQEQFKNYGITVVVTHLKAPEGYEMIRLKQMNFLLDELAHENTDILIICGDLNGHPREPVYQTLCDSHLLLSSAYKTTNNGGNEPPFTSARVPEENGQSQAIDYIWFTRKTLKPTQVLNLSDFSQTQTLPNIYFPSDHFDLVCDFVVTKS